MDILRSSFRISPEHRLLVRRALLLFLALLAPSTACPSGTFSISGTITAGVGTVVTLTGLPSGSIMAPTDSSGNYQFNGVPVGTYTIIPSHAGGAFAPASQVVRITGYSIGGINFFGQTPPPGNDPDLSDIIPVAAPKPFSIVGTGASRQLQYTHDTYDGGSGPLEILPVYNPASGNYQGFQQIYAFQSGTWTLVQSIPV